jgi:hypothetical protein
MLAAGCWQLLAAAHSQHIQKNTSTTWLIPHNSCSTEDDHTCFDVSVVTLLSHCGSLPIGNLALLPSNKHVHHTIAVQ